jgi:hypothetical protein
LPEGGIFKPEIKPPEADPVLETRNWKMLPGCPTLLAHFARGWDFVPEKRPPEGGPVLETRN